jgi:hypothetical protein
VVQPVTGLAIQQATLELKVTEPRQLTPVFTPANSSVKILTWESSNPAIVSVDNTGIVTGVALGGPVTITATTTDGTNISATCEITVVEGVAHPFGIISFRSDKTWNMPSTLIWSDYVTGSRCKKDTFSAMDTNGDCMQNVDGGNVYADIISFFGVQKYGTSLCTDGWRVPNEADYAALDTYLYPSVSNHQQHAGSAEYVSQWGAEYGGYYDGGSFAVVRRGEEGRLYGMYTGRTDRLRHVSLMADQGATSEICFRYGTANSGGASLRCVKDAQ